MASLPGVKLELAKKLKAGDHYVTLSGQGSDPALEELRKSNPRGFDVVVEATGVEKVLDGCLRFVRRGGTLAIFGVHSSTAKVNWSPSKIVGDQITIIGSISEVIRFPTAVDYLDSRRINVEGIVDRTYRLEEWDQCLDGLCTGREVKSAVVFD